MNGLRVIAKAREDKREKGADVLSKIKRLYESACAPTIPTNDVEIPKLCENVPALVGEVEKKDLELQFLPVFATEATKLRSEVSDLCKELMRSQSWDESLAEVG